MKQPPQPKQLDVGLDEGLIVGNFGRHLLVETREGRRVICHSRGKKSQAVVGDRVLWRASQDEGTIEKIEPRRNLLFRQDEIRTKSFAANLDQIVVVVAGEPEFSEYQLARVLIAAADAQVNVLIACNKQDLQVPFARAWARLEPYRAMGYQVMPLNLKTGDTAGFNALRELLLGKTSLIMGASGMGKSTLVNKLVPHADAQTAEISTALASGKHTTTSTTWYWMDDHKTTALIDSPGFQEFGLHHIEAMHLANRMPDLMAHATHCKFYNCTHLHEPGCAVMAAVAKQDSAESPNLISTSRYKIYSGLFAELKVSRY